MSTGYYATIIRDSAFGGRKVGFLLGPYDCEFCARERIPDARRLAAAVDPFTAFDAFGTARVDAPTLQPGVLNSKLENCSHDFTR